MKILITILLLPLFLSVQSMATVCSAKCSINEISKNSPQTTEKEGSELPSCHQQTTDSGSEEPSDKSEDCGSKICELDGVLKSELDLFNVGSIICSDSFGFPPTAEYITHELYSFPYFANAPPGISFFFNSPIYLQKSSFLI